MIILRLVLALFLLLPFYPASSDTVIINIGSIHTAETTKDNGQRRTYNNINPGLGYEFNNQIEIGFFYNSHQKISLYGLKRQPLIDQYNINWSYGILTGYNNSILPLIMLDKSVLQEQARIITTIAPITNKDLSKGFQLVFGLQLLI